MVKVWVDTDEMYPVHSITEKAGYFYQYQEIELSEAEQAFDAAQDIISNRLRRDMMDITGGNNQTAVYESSKYIYPCWCGETHRGEYAAETFNHHNCLHEKELLGIGPAGEGKMQAVCPLCGKAFIVLYENVSFI